MSNQMVIHDVDQGSPEWHALRCGMLTASEIKLIMTPALKVAANDKSRAHAYELLAQRITNYVEPSYISDDMLRGYDDEERARKLYAEHYASVTEIGFVTRRISPTLVLGYSPDGLVGDVGQIECKSRRQKYQIQTILDAMTGIPEEYILQVQTGLLVTGRAWCDYLSYSGGLPMARIRVAADTKMQDAIIAAAEAFEASLVRMRESYDLIVASCCFHATERQAAGAAITVGNT